MCDCKFCDKTRKRITTIKKRQAKIGDQINAITEKKKLLWRELVSMQEEVVEMQNWIHENNTIS